MTKQPDELTPADVNDFWFGADPKQWFAKSDAFDAEIREKFGEAVEAAGKGELDAWQETPEGALALVILLDQFTRNLNRGDPKTWASDEKAVAIAESAVARGFDMELATEKRRFLYMPYMHSENMEMQRKSIALSERVDSEEFQKYVHHHAGIVERFGRFPHRNAVLGRESTPEEKAYLEDDGFKG